MALAYDVDRRVTVFFGGDWYGSDEDSFFDDTWEYDGVRWKQITIEGPVPVRRSNAAMAYDENALRMMMVGGDNHNGELSDVWYFTNTGSGRGRWDYAGEMTNPNLGTGARTGATLTYDEQLRQLVLIGGRVEIDGDEYIHGDMKLWDGANWIGYPGAGLLLSRVGYSGGLYGLAWHATAYDSHQKRLVIHKGLLGCAHNNQICNPDKNDEIPSSFVVTVNEGTGAIASAGLGAVFDRQQVEMVYDPDRRRFVAFGGFDYIRQTDQAVIEDGARFVEMRANPVTEIYPYEIYTSFAPGSHPGRRLRHAMVYDRNRKRVVLYGGGAFDDIHRFNDTWELVAYAPVILQQPAGLFTRCAGEALQIPVTMQGFSVGMDEHAFQWYKNGSPVPEATGSALSISSLTTNDAGNYQLFVINRCGVQTNTTVAQVVVHDKPAIVAFNAARQNRCPGDSVTFSVNATSTLPVRYQWFRNGGVISGAEQSMLTLSNLKHEDTGDYHVSVINDCGTTPSARAHLQVGVTILDQPDDTAGPVCGWAGFFMTADGLGTLRYQWRLDGAPVRNDVYFSGATSPFLAIQPLLYAHEGKYDVVITDDCGALHSVTSRVATLTVTPGPQWFFRATNGPPGRFGHTLAYDTNRGVTVLFGGVRLLGDNVFDTLNDLWEWDGARWLQRMADSATEGWSNSPTLRWSPTFRDRPVDRYGHTMAYDSGRGTVVLFGGQSRSPDGSQILLNDLWEWDGAQWYFRATNGPSSGRADGAMSYDSARRRTVFFGGWPPGSAPDLKIVWEWDGERWHTNSTLFPSDYYQSVGGMVYDSFRGVTVFGPSVGGEYWHYWEWNGMNWVSRPGNISDPETFQLWITQNGSLAFDSYRRRSVFFGGLSGVVANRTGFYDGSDWSLLPTRPIHPVPRTETAMAYDSRRHAVVMFGGDLVGYSANPWVPQMTNDTWELIAVDTPLINEQPASQYRRAGEAATFRTAAIGPGQLSYQWYRDGAPLSAAVDARISGQTTSTLSIQNVQATDAGLYRAVVRSDCGETWSQSGLLTLRPDLQIFSAANTVTLVWSDPAVVLEQADSPAGPWSVVAQASSPFNPASVGLAKFFRLRPL